MSKTKAKIDFTPIAGRVVKLPAEALVWGVKIGGRNSVYAQMLEELVRGDSRMQVLEFDSEKARPGVLRQAAKLGYRVELALHNGKMYVRYMGLSPESERGKIALRAAIVEAVTHKGPDAFAGRSDVEITAVLRLKGWAVEAGTVGAVCKQMEQGGLLGRRLDGAWTVPEYGWKAAGEDIKVTEPELARVMRVVAEGPITVKALTKKMVIDGPKVNRALDILVARGSIEGEDGVFRARVATTSTLAARISGLVKPGGD